MTDVTQTTSSAGAAIISSIGIGSGLNVTSIISQLMVVQNQPVTLLQNQEAANLTLVSSFGQLQSALSTFQTSMQNLNKASSYQSVNAGVTNTSVATVSATPQAATGSYSLLVNKLAQSQTLVTAGQANSTSAIGTGTISFNFGSISGGTSVNGQYSGAAFTNAGAAPKTVTIDSSNNSLTGIASAINAANIGITASILNDGSSNPARLSLSVTNPGVANSLQISVAGDPALSSLLSQDPQGTQNLTETSTAQNAQFSLNGIAISSPTNTSTTTIPGVTLNLLTTNTTATTLAITKSTSGTTTAINAFVTAYNTIQSVISSATSYNATSKQSGALQGQNSVNSIMNQMQAILNAPVPGAPNAISMLAQVGVSFQSNGSMSLDNTKLTAALASNPSAVAGLFSSTGTSSDPLISYTSGSSSTKPGSYGVNITQLASQGNSVGSSGANLVITAGQNDTLQMMLDGVSANVTLAAGTYTSAASLASALQTAINNTSAFSTANLSASVSQSGGVLSVSSNSYGAVSQASFSGGNGLSGLLGTPVATGGQDVIGTINGILATGKGQTLTASTTDASSGLTMQVLGGSLGARGTINYTQGYSNALNNLMTSVLGQNGQIASATNALNTTNKNIENSITSDNNINAQVKIALQAQYTALDVTISKLNSTSTYLTQQLTALAANSNSSS